MNKKILIIIYLLLSLFAAFSAEALNMSPTLKQLSEKRKTPANVIIKKALAGKSDLVLVIIRSSQSA